MRSNTWYFLKKEEVPPGGQWMVWSSSPAHWRNDPQELGSGESPDHHLSVIKKCLQNTSGLNSKNIRQSSCFITKSKMSCTRSRYIEPQKPGTQLGSCGTGRIRSRKETLPVGNITITHCSLRTNCDDGSRSATSRPRQTKQTRQDYL